MRPSPVTLQRSVRDETIERLAAMPPIHDPRLWAYVDQQRHRPQDPIPLYSIAQVAHEAGYEPYAQALRDFVIDCYPHHSPAAHFERGRQRVRRGEWGGWQEIDWRWKDEEYLSHANRHHLQTIPWWDGQAFDGSVMVIHEGGFGDALMMYRYLPTVIDRCQRVYLLERPELRRLLCHAYDCYDREDGTTVFSVVTPNDTWPVFDRIIPSMSLPALLGPSEPDGMLEQAANDFHASGPYDPPLVDRPIGVVWAGRVTPDHRRSMAIAHLAPLANASRLLSLIPDQSASYNNVDDLGVSAFTSRFPFAERSPIRDFADTARLIMSCRAVVTIDSAVAHLAGCLGVPTYVLLPYAAAWLWGSQATKSDWYPSVTLVRQPYPGDWQTVIGRVVEHLGR